MILWVVFRIFWFQSVFTKKSLQLHWADNQHTTINILLRTSWKTNSEFTLISQEAKKLTVSLLCYFLSKIRFVYPSPHIFFLPYSYFIFCACALEFAHKLASSLLFNAYNVKMQRFPDMCTWNRAEAGQPNGWGVMKMCEMCLCVRRVKIVYKKCLWLLFIN